MRTEKPSLASHTSLSPCWLRISFEIALNHRPLPHSRVWTPLAKTSNRTGTAHQATRKYCPCAATSTYSGAKAPEPIHMRAFADFGASLREKIKARSSQSTSSVAPPSRQRRLYVTPQCTPLLATSFLPTTCSVELCTRTRLCATLRRAIPSSALCGGIGGPEGLLPALPALCAAVRLPSGSKHPYVYSWSHHALWHQYILDVGHDGSP